jgi:hypothetical protein
MLTSSGDGPALIDPDLLELMTDEERALYVQYLDYHVVQAASDPFAWVEALFPTWVKGGFGPHHRDFWRWLWAIDAEAKPDPFVAIWPRGGAKSTSAELAVCALAARGMRHYGLYVSETQDQADDHVGNVATLLESPAISAAYPELGERLLGKFGHAKGWKVSRLRTASGFTLDAIGLDKAARGIKVDEHRPDFIVLDDIDGETDSGHITEKKKTILTRKLLPAGSTNVGVLAIQNKVSEHSLFAQLADGRADFLASRILSGPIPAIEGLEYEAIEQDDGRRLWKITGGRAVWSGQSLEVCESQMNDWGLSAFLSEAQHDTEPPGGGMFDHLDWLSIRVTIAEVPELKRVVCWVDPAVTSTDNSDSQGIIVDGLGVDGHIYRLWAWEGRTTPLDAMQRAIRQAIRWGAEKVGVETDQGGETWESVYREALRELVANDDDPVDLDEGQRVPRFDHAKAGSVGQSKAARAAQMLVDYETDVFRHLEGTHRVLERSLSRFPKTKPFDLTDAAYWAWRDLDPKPRRLRRRGRARSSARRSIGDVGPGALAG